MHTKNAYIQLKAEGFHFLYRGILPPLCQKTISVSIMFGMYNHYQQVLNSMVPQWNTHLKNSTAAAAAGLTEAVLAPFERVQMLLQDNHFNQRFRNTAHAFAELRQYGFREYYRGLTPILLRNSVSNALFFTLREEISHRMPSQDHWTGKLLSDFCCGAMVITFFKALLAFTIPNLAQFFMFCRSEHSLAPCFIRWTSSSRTCNAQWEGRSIVYGKRAGLSTRRGNALCARCFLAST